MAEILKSKSIYYNDVNLIAQPCKVKSRKDIPSELNRIIVSPMQSIIGETFAIKANKLGLSLALHRFCSAEKEADLFTILPNKKNVFASIGLNDWDRVEILSDAGVENWLIDMANGYMSEEIDACVKKLLYNVKVEKLMMGNVHTSHGFENLNNISSAKNIKKFIRIGIAGGSPCATNDSTGYNRGPITELMAIDENRNYDVDNQITKSEIIADGGVKNSGYAAKAFGAGADYVMMGGYFVKAFEAETHVTGDGSYWGGASHKQQILQSGKPHRHSEGKEFKVQDELKPLEELVTELWGGLSSAVSYGGYKSLTDFIGNGVFELKQNSLPPKR
jgi:GMP reductase